MTLECAGGVDLCWLLMLLAQPADASASGPASTRPADASPVISLADSIDALRDRFNGDKDRIRFLGLFSPT